MGAVLLSGRRGRDLCYAGTGDRVPHLLTVTKFNEEIHKMKPVRTSFNGLASGSFLKNSTIFSFSIHGDTMEHSLSPITTPINFNTFG